MCNKRNTSDLYLLKNLYNIGKYSNIARTDVCDFAWHLGFVVVCISTECTLSLQSIHRFQSSHGSLWRRVVSSVTFRVRRSRSEMYSGHGCLCALCLCVCLSVPRHIPTLLHKPRCKLGNGREYPAVVHYWADLQSVHGFRWHDTIAPNAKCQRLLVLALSPVSYWMLQKT